MVNTFLFALGATVFQNLFAIVFAMALNTKIKSKNFLRMLLFAPCMLSPVVVAFIWQFIYMPDGMLNHLLGTDITWLGNRKTALFCVVIAHVWMWIGYSSTIYMSNLQSISTDILEAAAIDGAGPWQKFKSITLPMLAPASATGLPASTWPSASLTGRESQSIRFFSGPGMAWLYSGLNSHKPFCFANGLAHARHRFGGGMLDILVHERHVFPAENAVSDLRVLLAHQGSRPLRPVAGYSCSRAGTLRLPAAS